MGSLEQTSLAGLSWVWQAWHHPSSVSSRAGTPSFQDTASQVASRCCQVSLDRWPWVRANSPSLPQPFATVVGRHLPLVEQGQTGSPRCHVPSDTLCLARPSDWDVPSVSCRPQYLLLSACTGSRRMEMRGNEIFFTPHFYQS